MQPHPNYRPSDRHVRPTEECDACNGYPKYDCEHCDGGLLAGVAGYAFPPTRQITDGPPEDWRGGVVHAIDDDAWRPYPAPEGFAWVREGCPEDVSLAFESRLFLIDKEWASPSVFGVPCHHCEGTGETDCTHCDGKGTQPARCECCGAELPDEGWWVEPGTHKVTCSAECAGLTLEEHEPHVPAAQPNPYGLFAEALL